MKFTWLWAADVGNYYAAEGSDLKGWLSPALFKHFNEAAKKIYTHFEVKPA